MTDRLRTPNPYSGAYYQGSQPRPAAVRQQSISDGGLSTRKTMLVLVVVVGCFAVLWPKLFYPMLVNNANHQMKPGPVDRTTGCCDVISEVDLDTIKIMSELCGTIIENSKNTRPKEIVSQCKKAVLETCGIDISAALQDRISLGHSVKQILEEVRSLNGSLCLKYNFGLSPWKLGVPHRVHIQLDSAVRQERPSHLRPGMIHPAFRERGRAIPETDVSPETLRKTAPPPRIVEGRPGPIPGMRPAMSGAGHVVPPPKHANYGFMGVLMPIYTVAFVLFFTYTIMKLASKKKPDYVGAPLYPPCETDEQFHKEVFEANKHYFNRPKDTSKIVVNAVAALLEEVDQEIEAHTPTKTTTTNEQDESLKPNGTLPKDEDQGSVTVMAMETTASAESGKKWSRPDSPVLPHPQAMTSKEPTPPPQQIFLEGSLPPQSQLLVADSATEAEKDPEDDSPVVLAGKMTLSVISLDSEDSSGSGKKPDSLEEGRRTSGSNTSDEFVKIDADELEEQINDIIVEAETVALAEEERARREEEERIETIEVTDLPKTPNINDKDEKSCTLEEINNQFNTEVDLLQILKEREPEGKVSLPVTDIINEFLASEENTLDIRSGEAIPQGNQAKHLEEEFTEIDRHDQKSQIKQDVADEPNSSLVEGIEEKQAIQIKQIELSELQQIEKKIDEQEAKSQEPMLQHDEEAMTSIQQDPQEQTKTGATMADVLLQGLQVKDGNLSSEETQEQYDDEKEPLNYEEEIEYVEEESEGDEEGEDEEELSEENDLGLNEGSEDMLGGIDDMVAYNDISDEDEVEDDEEEIEEIIEYVDNTDEEGEEIVEINANEDDRHHHLHQNGDGN